MCIPLDILFVCDFCIPSGFCLFNFLLDFFFPFAITINIQETIFLNISVVVTWFYPLLPLFISFHLLKQGQNGFSFDKIMDNDTTSAIINFINILSVALVSCSFV